MYHISDALVTYIINVFVSSIKFHQVKPYLLNQSITYLVYNYLKNYLPHENRYEHCMIL